MTGLSLTDALRAVIASIPDRLPVERLDRVWVFPPKEIGGRESGLVVVAALPDPPRTPADGHLDLVTLRYEADRARPRATPRVDVTEQGSAPPDRIPRVIAGVVARLTESDEPDEHSIRGQPGAWRALLEGYGIPVVDRGNGE